MRSKLGVSLVLSGLAAISGCGSRVDDARISAIGNNPVVVVANTPARPLDVRHPRGSLAPAPETSSAAALPTVVATARTTAAGADGATRLAPAAPDKPLSGQAAAVGLSAGSPNGKACAQEESPIVIGQVGVFSGLVGQSTGNMRLGVAVWARAVNAAGGIACHPVRLYQSDDGSDPAKTASIAQDMIESKKIVAFVGANVPVTIAAFRSVVDRFGVPAIGGDLVTPDWFEDPALFAQGGDPGAAILGGVSLMAKSTGRSKVGVASCVEASACSFYAKTVTERGSKSGLSIVANQTASLTQTDYTSVCQNFKSAGAELAAVALDAASLTRFARSCAGIGWEVPMATPNLSMSAGLVNDKNLSRVGLYAGSPVAPFMVDKTPAQQSFHHALQSYAPTQQPDQPTMVGWTAGKLFEAVVGSSALGPSSAAITTELVLKGIYALKNETLGGLAPPLNFVKGRPTPAVQCFYLYKLSDGQFVAPYGDKKFCL